jgi:superfamily II DNA/RNA helicase
MLNAKIRFRDKKPLMIDLTEEERLPSTLEEKQIRCKHDEKDLYTFYFLNKIAKGKSTIVFANSITCVMRLNSILKVLGIKNHCLHSKMQQK